MSVQLFNIKGESELFTVRSYKTALSSGIWFLEDPTEEGGNEPVESLDVETVEVKIVDNTFLRKNTSYPGYGIGSNPKSAEWVSYDNRAIKKKRPQKKLSNKAIREKAKKAGLVDYGKARIQTLRKALSL
jgi:hypothetical protein